MTRTKRLTLSAYPNAVHQLKTFHAGFFSDVPGEGFWKRLQVAYEVAPQALEAARLRPRRGLLDCSETISQVEELHRRLGSVGVAALRIAFDESFFNAEYLVLLRRQLPILTRKNLESFVTGEISEAELVGFFSDFVEELDTHVSNLRNSHLFIGKIKPHEKLLASVHRGFDDLWFTMAAASATGRE